MKKFRRWVKKKRKKTKSHTMKIFLYRGIQVTTCKKSWESIFVRLDIRFVIMYTKYNGTVTVYGYKFKHFKVIILVWIIGFFFFIALFCSMIRDFIVAEEYNFDEFDSLCIDFTCLFELLYTIIFVVWSIIQSQKVLDCILKIDD